MASAILPQKHPQFWVDLPAAYTACVAVALIEQGIPIADLWVDPSDPRDATIKLAGPRSFALVWDEASGWRHGPFVSGRRTMRTELVASKTRYLGDEVLPQPRTVARLLEADDMSARAPQPYRSHFDYGDGLDLHLEAYMNASDLQAIELYQSQTYRLILPLLASYIRMNLAVDLAA
ncbi:DUF6292 family protein [Nonomuraea sp. NPDC050643]|uniref:DUF6292 family protein n=1 Tax=Nonomuraea sp. NPDC050643 TaxID=3155660 RepID=UPI0033C65AA5